MKKYISARLILLTSLFLFGFSYWFLAQQYSLTDADEFVGHGEPGIVDVLDYHFIAVNYAFTGRFPVVGFLKDENAYKIKQDKNLDAVYLNMFREYGPVVTFVRAPLYSFVVGTMYKIFGFKYSYNLWLNLFIMSVVIALVPIISYLQWGRGGYLLGMLAAVFVLYFSCGLQLSTMDVNVFSIFITTLIFISAVLAEKKDKLFFYSLFGFTLGLGLLTKQALAFAPVVYAVFMYFKYRSSGLKNAIKKYGAFVGGLCIAVLPYSGYINYVSLSTVNERAAWCSKVKASMEPIELEHIEESHDYKVFQGHYSGNYELETDENKAAKCIMVREISQYKDSMLARKVLTYLIKWAWTYHSRTLNFILITNGAGDMLLTLHNEYCGDNAFRFEWLFDKNAFYRRYDKEDKSVAVKLASFYLTYPFFFCKVMWAKFRASLNLDGFGWLYWLGVLLWSLRLLQLIFFNHANKKKFIAGGFALVGWLCASFFYLPAYTALAPLVIFIISLLFYKPKYERQLLLAYPVIWVSLFLLIVLVMPNTTYLMFLFPVSCAYIVYLFAAIIKGFIVTDYSEF